MKIVRSSRFPSRRGRTDAVRPQLKHAMPVLIHLQRPARQLNQHRGELPCPRVEIQRADESSVCFPTRFFLADSREKYLLHGFCTDPCPTDTFTDGMSAWVSLSSSSSQPTDHLRRFAVEARACVDCGELLGEEDAASCTKLKVTGW